MTNLSLILANEFKEVSLQVSTFTNGSHPIVLKLVKIQEK